MHEVHAPPLAGPDRRRRWTAVQGEVFPPTHAHPQLQAVQAIQAVDALLVHRPALSSQQHPDAREAERRTRVRQLPNP